MNTLHPKDHRKIGKQALLLAKIIAGLASLEALWAILFYMAHQFMEIEQETSMFYLKYFKEFRDWVYLGRFVSVIFFCVWVYNLHKNMEDMGIYASYSGVWIFFGWIVPIGNFFIPYQIIQEVYVGVQSMRRLDEEACEHSSTVGWWWAALIATNLFWLWVFFMMVEATFAESPLLHASFWLMLGSIASLITPLLQIKVMRELARQEELTLQAFAEGRNATETPY